MKNKHCLLFFYAPETHLEIVKSALFQAGAGKLGNYDQCAFQIKGIGQFRPLPKSQPHIGQTNELTALTEYKVEILCQEKYLDAAIAALKKSHPYEEPAYGVLALE